MRLDRQHLPSWSKTQGVKKEALTHSRWSRRSTSTSWGSTTHPSSTPIPMRTAISQLKISTPLKAHQSLVTLSSPLMRTHRSPSHRLSSSMASPMLMATHSLSLGLLPLTASSPTTKPQIPTTTHQKLTSTALSSSTSPSRMAMVQQPSLRRPSTSPASMMHRLWLMPMLSSCRISKKTAASPSPHKNCSTLSMTLMRIPSAFLKTHSPCSTPPKAS